jgi:peptidyl-prolyl cis-trans isomerase D
LLKVTTQEELAGAQKLADSLKTMIEKGADFGPLAMQYSTDQGSALNGGDLGWFGRGQMVKPFEEAAFNNAKNGVSIAMSQFGIHIVQTTDKGKPSLQARVAFLVRNVTPSSRTISDVFQQASQFAINNNTVEKFNAAVTAEKLNKKLATVREADLNIMGLENARILVRAAYEAEVNDILKTSQESPIFELGKDFVIAVLTKATEEGEATFEQAKTRVELAVIKQKKAELLVKKAANAASGQTNLSTVAGTLGTDVKNVTNVNFNSFSIPGLGVEPALTGTVASMDANQISKPVEGNNGVYVALVTSVNQGTDQNVSGEKIQLSQNLFYRVASQVFETQRKKAEITDKRAKFY